MERHQRYHHTHYVSFRGEDGEKGGKRNIGRNDDLKLPVESQTQREYLVSSKREVTYRCINQGYPEKKNQ